MLPWVQRAEEVGAPAVGGGGARGALVLGVLCRVQGENPTWGTPGRGGGGGW